MINMMSSLVYSYNIYRTCNTANSIQYLFIEYETCLKCYDNYLPVKF